MDNVKIKARHSGEWRVFVSADSIRLQRKKEESRKSARGIDAKLAGIQCRDNGQREPALMRENEHTKTAYEAGTLDCRLMDKGANGDNNVAKMHDGKRDNIPHNGQSQRRMIFAGNRR